MHNWIDINDVFFKNVFSQAVKKGKEKLCSDKTICFIQSKSFRWKTIFICRFR
jgi:hypothetical protein